MQERSGKGIAPPLSRLFCASLPVFSVSDAQQAWVGGEDVVLNPVSSEFRNAADDGGGVEDIFVQAIACQLS